MPPRAFPFPLHIGTDICQVSRICRLLASHKGGRFLERILTRDERALVPADPKTDRPHLPLGNARLGHDGNFHALKKQNPVLWRKANFVAGRFAAKEAVFKAHPFRRLTFHDITIVRSPKVSEGQENPNGSGPPMAVIRGEREGKPDQTAMISISHDGDYATAVCLAYEPSPSTGGQGEK